MSFFPIHIGTRDWDDPAWQESFYPDTLPADWRFCYYSNRLRSLLVPAEAWSRLAPAQPAQWPADSDPGFGLLLEPPSALTQAAANRAPLAPFLDLIAPLVSQLVGWLLRPAAPPDVRWLSSWLDVLSPLAPVCLDLPREWHTAEVEAWRLAHGVGGCWHPSVQPSPPAGGGLLVCIAVEGTPRGQRTLLEKIHAWQADGGRAGLYFAGPAAPAQAQQARLLADIMGV